MTRDEIYQLVNKIVERDRFGRHKPWDYEFLKCFAEIIAGQEREACAKLAQETVCDTHIPTGIQIYGTKVAKAIRARNL